MNTTPSFRTAWPFCLATVAGILAVQQLDALPSPSLIFGVGLAVLGSMTCKTLRWLGGFLAGACWAMTYATIQLQEVLPVAVEGQDVRVEGRVLDLPHRLENGLRFDFGVESSSSPEVLPHILRLNWYKTDATVKAGERWRLTVRLKRPHGFFNPGGFDYEQWLFAQGIRATGYVREDTENACLAAAPPYTLAAWRQGLADALDASLPGHDMRGIIKALTLGIEDDIEPAQWEVLRRTGTAHLVAISGSHIALVAGAVYFLTNRLTARLGGQRWSPPTVAALIAFLAALFYAALADFAIPTQRALIMTGLVMGGIALKRHLRIGHTLALALLAVSLYDPLAVIAPGFWLSFGAVGLILLAIAGRLHPPGFWSGLGLINGVTALGLAPLLLLFFQQVSLISPLTNLLAVPLIGMVAMPLCLLGALLLSLWPAAAQWVLSLTANWLLQPTWRVLDSLSALSFAQWQHPSPPVWTALLAVPGVLLLLAPRGIPGRWLGAVMLLPAFARTPAHPAPGNLRLTLLDVGQGLAVVIETAAHTLVFDTGARLGPHFDMGTAVIEPFLRQQGIPRIDTLVVSHGDNDHIGGAAALLNHWPVSTIYTSVPQRLGQTPRQTCQAGQQWRWDGVDFTMLSPLGALGNENDNSCVLKVGTSRGSVLLTGDIERPAEQTLVERYGDGLSSTVLIAPHHGSKTSSSPAFLARVKPRYVLIPAGYRNRYGFPHPSVLKRYRDFGAEVFSTAQAGAISYEIGAASDFDTMKPASYRRSHGRYWNAKPDE